MAEYTFKHNGMYDQYLTIKKKDLKLDPVFLDMEGKFTPMSMETPMPVVEEKKKAPVEVGYRAIRVDFNNRQTYGVVTYVNQFGLDYIIKIQWDDGKYDHQYLSVLRKEILVCPPNAV
jgi:hypothetical protein